MLGVYTYPLKYSTELASSEIDEIKKLHENYIDKFIDISTYSFKLNKFSNGTQRVYLNKSDNQTLKDETPKYEVVKKEVETYFPKIYGKHEYLFIDKQTNNVIDTQNQIVHDSEVKQEKIIYKTIYKEKPVYKENIVYKDKQIVTDIFSMKLSEIKEYYKNKIDNDILDLFDDKEELIAYIINKEV